MRNTIAFLVVCIGFIVGLTTNGLWSLVGCILVICTILFGFKKGGDKHGMYV